MKDPKNVLHYAKRLSDYCRISLEIGTIKKDSAIAMARKDFVEALKEYNDSEEGKEREMQEELDKWVSDQYSTLLLIEPLMSPGSDKDVKMKCEKCVFFRKDIFTKSFCDIEPVSIEISPHRNACARCKEKVESPPEQSEEDKGHELKWRRYPSPNKTVNAVSSDDGRPKSIVVDGEDFVIKWHKK